jgi:hypothetical protein
MCSVNLGVLTEKDYVVLKPRDQVTQARNLDCFEGIEQAGQYVLVAHYQDHNPYGVPAAPPGASWLSEEIASVPVKFEVLPK